MENRPTILIVEDEELVREFAVELLCEFGYEVLSAADGHEAIALIDDGANRIDLLSTDIVMPGELAGYALAREARRRRPALPILYTSGYTNRNPGGGAEALGTMVVKPYRPDQLRTEIERALRTM